MRSFRKRKGYLLTEAVVWVVGMSIALLISARLLVSTMRLKNATEINTGRLVSLRNLSDSFRQDVARSAKVVDQAKIGMEEFKTSSACLVLQKDDQLPLVYCYRGGKLERHEKTVASQPASWFVPLDPEIIAIEFQRPTGDSPLATLRMRIQTSKNTPERMVDIQAFPGGDLQ